MVEYTYEDIIMDPNDPRLEGAIGKECYVSDFPKIALNNARDNLIPDRLKRIAKEETCPFVDEEEEDNWAVIILKKEEPTPKYVPFKSKEGFLERYMEVKDELESDSFEGSLLQCGMWIKVEGVSDGYCMVTEIWNDGIVLGYSKLFTIEEVPGRYSTVTETTTWDNLCNDFTFLDGTPCGKLAEE